MKRWILVPVGACLILVMVVTACTARQVQQVKSQSNQTRIVYAAIGASETFGVGADDPLKQSWPQVFSREALPGAAVHNFGIPGATVAEALRDEVPKALAVHPNLVTVWLNVNDVMQGVPVDRYEAQLQQLVHALRQDGHARVLVANMPRVDQLPAIKACLPDSAGAGADCPAPSSLVPSAVLIDEMVDTYNAAIARVVAREGAELVNLRSGDFLIGQHPEWVSSDGFHPNTQGYAVIAGFFERAYRAKSKAA